MIRSVYFASKTSQPQTGLSDDEIIAAIQNPQGLLWVSLENTSHEEMHHMLGEVFHFHPLAIEDAESPGYQPPKVDDFETYLFIIAHAIAPEIRLDRLETMELNLFLGRNFLVTSHIDPVMTPVESAWHRLERDERLVKNGADALCHAVLDALVDEYMPLLDAMDEEIDYLEDQVLQRPKPAVLERILDLKHATLGIRRVVGPQREVINRLSRDDFPMIDQTSRIYFRDIYDHLVRIQDLTDNVRDVVTGTLDTYLSATSNRLNEVMKTLTVVSTIFLPLTFLAGVYGMNFVVFPEIHWQYGYAFAWFLFFSIAVFMVVLFKKRGWF